MRWLESESNFDIPSAAAISMLREAIAQQPNNPVLHARLGEIFEKSRLFGDGADAYEAAARQAPEDFAAWPKLANCYVELDRPEAAHERRRLAGIAKFVEFQVGENAAAPPKAGVKEHGSQAG